MKKIPTTEMEQKTMRMKMIPDREDTSSRMATTVLMAFSLMIMLIMRACFLATTATILLAYHLLSLLHLLFHLPHLIQSCCWLLFDGFCNLLSRSIWFCLNAWRSSVLRLSRPAPIAAKMMIKITRITMITTMTIQKILFGLMVLKYPLGDTCTDSILFGIDRYVFSICLLNVGFYVSVFFSSSIFICFCFFGLYFSLIIHTSIINKLFMIIFIIWFYVLFFCGRHLFPPDFILAWLFIPRLQINYLWLYFRCAICVFYLFPPEFILAWLFIPRS